MKHKKTSKAILTLLGTLLVGGGFQNTNAATATWSGASTLIPREWSNKTNWSPAAIPAPADTVVFGATGATNAAGLVNNTVSSDAAITILNITAQVSANAKATNYYTTLIQPGVTLSTPNINVGYLGDPSPSTNDPSYIYTVVGPGAAFNMGNTNSPATVGGLVVTSGGRTTGLTHFGLLDLSGLDTFTEGMTRFWVGYLDATGTVPNDRPAGGVRLAKTNIMFLPGPGEIADTATALAPFRVGDSRTASIAQLVSYVELGQKNEIYTSLMKVGGARSMSAPGSVLMPALMYFRSGLINPTLQLRGSNAVTRLGTLSIGDNIGHTTAGGNSAGGNLDLTGGTVDAYINNLIVGRSATATGTGNALAFSSGTLTWTAGIFDVKSLYVGFQFANMLNSATGMVNVASSAILRANDVTIGRDAGSLAGTGVGTINIDGGTLIVSNSFAENNLTGGNGSSTVILTNNGVLNLVNPMIASFDDLEYSSGTLYATNSTFTFGTVNLYAPATQFVCPPALTLSPAGAGTVGTMNFNNGGLTLNGDALTLDLAGTLDNINESGALTLFGTNSISINLLPGVTAGVYPIITYGSLASGGLTNFQFAPGIYTDSRYTFGLDNTAPNINLTVSGSAVPLTWSGGNNANAWDLNSTINWNSGTEKFFQLDQVTFDDSGDASSPVQLSGSLIPNSVTFSAASKHYTLAGSGKITGGVGLNLTGGAKVTLLTTNNDYTGGTTINAGILEIGDGTSGDGALAGNVINNAELDFNPISSNNVTAVISGSGVIVKKGPGITRLSASSPTLIGAGVVNVQQGTLQAGNANSPFGSSYYPNYIAVNGGTIDVAGNSLTNTFYLTGSGVGGNGALVNSTPGSVTLRDVELQGAATIGGDGSWTVQQSTATTAEYGLIANQYKITKVGTNQIAINGRNPGSVFNLDLGAVDILDGQLTLIGYLTLGSQPGQPITVFTNGYLGLRTFSTNILSKAYVFNDGSYLKCYDGSPTIDGSVTLNGTVSFDVNANVPLTINCPVTGGTLIKGVSFYTLSGISTGTGTLVLAGGVNAVSGFQVQSGTVLLTNSSTISAPQLVLAGGTLSALGRTDGTLTLASGQSLVGNGTVLGIVSSPSGSSVTPFATNGIITVSSNLTLRGTTTLDLNRAANGVVTNSLISMGSNATLDCGGALVLTSSGQPLKYKDTFKLFKAGAIVNPFSDGSITYPTLGTGLYWTNRIAIDGTVAVAATDPTNQPVLSVTMNAGPVLSVNWPTNYVTYGLQGQTNSLSVGLSTNWVNMNTTNNQIDLPINPSNGSVFLRLLQQ